MNALNKKLLKKTIPLMLLCAAIDSRSCYALDEWLYAVNSGDTLIGVSQKYLADPNDWISLQTLNQVKNPRRLVPGQLLRIPIDLLKNKPLQARLISYSGSIQIKDALGADEQPQIGEVVSSGTQITTGANSSVFLVFSDNSTLLLQPNSSITLENYPNFKDGNLLKTKLRLQQGRLDVHANPEKKKRHQLQIITPSAVAAVRGTQFRVSAEPSISREETTEGAVAFTANGKELTLLAGYGSVAKNGQAPSKPQPLLQAPSLDQLPKTITRLPMQFDIPAQEGAVAWNSQITPDAVAENILLEKHTLLPHFTFADLPDGRYKLRVRSENAMGLQSLDAIHTFELSARPFAPLALAPANSETVRNDKPILKWTESDSKTKYHVELARDADFQQILKAFDTELTQLIPEQALMPGTYYWRVAAVDSQKMGPYSDSFQFSYKQPPSVPANAVSTIKVGKKMIEVSLLPPTDGMHYEANLAQQGEPNKQIWHGVSDDGKFAIPNTATGKLLLSFRLVEADATASPYASHIIEVPSSKAWTGLILLAPILGI